MPQQPSSALPLSPTDLHVLLVLAQDNLYGYAILQAVEQESTGLIKPDLGALYRALARLGSAGLVEDAQPPTNSAPSPGKKRRYYGITGFGQQVLGAETARLRSVLEIASHRLSPSEQQS